MNGTDQPNDSLGDTPKLPVWRRALLIGGTSAAAAGIAGLASGIGVGAREVPPAPRSVAARQRFLNKVVMITGATSGDSCQRRNGALLPC